MTVRGQDRTLEEGLAQSIVVLPRPKRIAFYARTSSEDQRERETIKTQIEALYRYLAAAGDAVVLVGEFYDDGVSGMISMADRPKGAELLAMCGAGLVDEVWVTRPNRLGRKAVHILVAFEQIEACGVAPVGVLDAIESKFMLTIKSAVAEEDRRVLLENMREGIERTARHGGYCGGVVAFGLCVSGERETARFELDEEPFWEGMSAAALVRWMFDLLLEGWSPERIAEHWNALRVPTAWQKDRLLRRGKRGQNTDPFWRGSRIRTMAMLPIYKGVTTYGKHPPKRPDGSKPIREVIHGRCVALVSEEIWEAAQVAIRGRRKWNPGDSRAMHLLRSLIHCAHCGLNYSGGNSRGRSWYKCNGRMTPWARHHGRCHASAVDGAIVEPLIKRDICDFLLFPGDVVEDLVAEVNDAPGQAVEVAEEIVVRSRLQGLADEEANLARLARKGLLTDERLAEGQGEVEREKTTLLRRLDELATPPKRGPKQERPVVADDLVEQLREQVEEGLSEEQWRDLFTLLVKGVVATTEIHDGQPLLRLQIQYNFAPERERGVSDRTDTD